MKIWDASNKANWALIQTYIGHESDVWILEEINKDTIASASMDGIVQIWSIKTAKTIRTIDTDQSVLSLKLLNDGFHLATGLLNGSIFIYNIKDGSLTTTLVGHTDYISDLLLLNGDGNNLLASSSGDSTIRIWDLNSYTTKYILTGHDDGVEGLKQISSNILCSGSMDATIKLWNTMSGELIRTLTGHISTIYWSLDKLIDDEQMLISGSLDRTIKLWDWKTGECSKTVDTIILIWTLSVI